MTAVWGIYDEEIRPWEGVMQALYSDRHRNLHDGYGLKYETAAGHPSLNVGYMPWRGAHEHYLLMQAMSHTCVFGILLRDRDGGEVRIGRDGEPVVRYRLSDYDRRHLRVGIEGAAEMHEAAGAQRIFSSQSEWVAYDPGGASGNRARFMRERRRLRLRARPDPARLVPPDGLRAHGRLAGDVRLRPGRADVGRARPVRARRQRVPDLLGGQPADLDPGDRTHGRPRARRPAQLTVRARTRTTTRRRASGMQGT